MFYIYNIKLKVFNFDNFLSIYLYIIVIIIIYLLFQINNNIVRRKSKNLRLNTTGFIKIT